MLLAPTPSDEAERLAELRALRILDTPPEERFDGIVRLTRHLFQAPVVYIALIDADRQWFKAQIGLTVLQTPRAISFCGHAILQDKAFIIPDARLDPRFADNPLVTGEPYVRFYAGHPLSGPHGRKVGTLCIVDHEPRTFDDQHEATLKQLAALVEEQLRLVDLIAAQRELIETKTALVATQQRLATELGEAAEYVRSLLPAPLAEGPIRTDWEYVASSQLGGDLFGYHWLDDTRFALYLFDVCGHGVGASLLASSVHSALRRQTLPGCDFRDPGQVLAALDAAFPMSEHGEKFFTIWYGVYDTATRELRHAAAGHHDAVLLTDTDTVTPVGLHGLMIGVLPERPIRSERTTVPAGSRLYLFSDGAFEIRQSDRQMLGWQRLADMLRESWPQPELRLPALTQRLRRWQGRDEFADDYSLVEFEFA
ncbi:MAG TPA: GAF domain-containing SpoIIE family protein phosphatase [Planctomycetaceae bacterium]|nr:GAF domain-containing SpoIIE family protein phosphatase [Planctomycetaceae bacterium]